MSVRAKSLKLVEMKEPESVFAEVHDTTILRFCALPLGCELASVLTPAVGEGNNDNLAAILKAALGLTCPDLFELSAVEYMRKCIDNN